MKKGQITVFIILGILILFSIAIASYLHQRQTRTPTQITTLPETVDPQIITDYVNSCIKKVAQEGVYKLAAQGGYLNPKGATRYGDEGDFLPVHYYFGPSVVPYAVNGTSANFTPLSAITAKLSRYIAQELPSCFDFSTFEDKGYIVEQPAADWEALNFSFKDLTLDYTASRPSFTALPRLETNDIAIGVTYPMKFVSDDVSFELKDFFITLPLRFALVHKIANQIALKTVEQTRLKQPLIMLEVCSDLSAQDRMINIYTLPSPYTKEVLVQIVDSKPIEQGLAPLKYQFAVRNAFIMGECAG
ncbi:hypothetical protein J4219_05775 [Candidatus Woesearchaeota archaeon]|nr:hypothetical protein [Candidatus Woesearchaeota archaeon]